MEQPTESKRLLIVGLGLAIALDTAGQLLWKICIAGLPASAEPWPIVLAALHQPLFVILVVIFLLQLFNWLKVLEHADLSYAQPITSLSYVTVCLLSAMQLGERIGLAKTIGVLCVLGGVALVSQGKPREQNEARLQA
jgi:drug/metabolite transporter (DMT)-like permease